MTMTNRWLFIALFAHLIFIGTARYDKDYPHHKWGRTFGIRIGKCSSKCKETRPTGEGGNKLWVKGKFDCDNDSRRGWKCTCDKCQRDCSFSEVQTDRSCIIAPFRPPKHDVVGQIVGSIGDFIGKIPVSFTKVLGKIPIDKILNNKIAGKILDKLPIDLKEIQDGVKKVDDDPWKGAIMGFANNIFGTFGSGMSMDSLSAAIAADINRRTKELIQCMDAKISKFQEKIYDFSVREALSSYQIALNTDESDIENRADKVHDAWAKHVNVIRSKFVDDEDALFMHSLLRSGTIHDLAATFVLVSTDYLKYLRTSGDVDFNARLQTTNDCLQLLIDFVTEARDAIEDEWDRDLHKLPCRNGGKVEDDLDDWVKDFDPEYIHPLIQYKDAIASIKFGLPSKEAKKVLFKSSIQKDFASKCRLKVSAISKQYRGKNKDHPGRVGDGVYFYFDRRQLDLMMGHKNWAAVNLKAVNVGAAEEMEVRIWRGDVVKDPFYASGRKEDKKTLNANDWAVGDEIELKDCVDGKWENKPLETGSYCGDGFVPQIGDIPGWGMVEGAGGGQRVKDCQECANLCAERGKCGSYECSTSELKCNLNLDPNPSKSAHGDYIFCTDQFFDLKGPLEYLSWDPLSCPSDSVQVGKINADIGGCGLEKCDVRYQDSYANIEECRDGCLRNRDCKSFTWATLNGDKSVQTQGKTVCGLYDSDIPNNEWGPLQIMCKPKGK